MFTSIFWLNGLIDYIFIVDNNFKPYTMHKKTDAELLQSYAVIQAKLNKLETLNSLAPYRSTNVFFYGANGMFLNLEQSDIPFNINNEIKKLLSDSIDFYQFEINQINQLLKQNENGTTK